MSLHKLIALGELAFKAFELGQSLGGPNYPPCANCGEAAPNKTTCCHTDLCNRCVAKWQQMSDCPFHR